MTLEEFRAIRGNILFYGELRSLKIEPTVKREAIKKAAKVRPCEHVAHETMVEACYRRDEIKRVTGADAWFVMCPRCAKWRVTISRQLSKHARRKLTELAAHERVSINEYLH
jgi:hypothetical protein